MYSKIKYSYIILTLLIVSCTPKVVTNIVNKSYPSVNDHEIFVVVDKDTLKLNTSLYLGQIEFKDNGLTINCNYKKAMEKIQYEARNAGGNLIIINEDKVPLLYGRDCHQIKASVYRVENPRIYEKTINWNSNRKLIIEDFKASTSNRPFQAATLSSIGYYIYQIPMNGNFEISVTNQFYCIRSYFKHSTSDSAVLAHEQLHFDISEIYARRLLKSLLEAKLDRSNVHSIANKLLNEITYERSIKQDEYDTEVYENPQLLGKWTIWVASELERLKDYKQKEIVNYSVQR